MAKCTKKKKKVENLEKGVFNLFTLKIRKTVDKLKILSELFTLSTLKTHIYVNYF